MRTAALRGTKPPTAPRTTQQLIDQQTQYPKPDQPNAITANRFRPQRRQQAAAQQPAQSAGIAKIVFDQRTHATASKQQAKSISQDAAEVFFL